MTLLTALPVYSDTERINIVVHEPDPRIPGDAWTVDIVGSLPFFTSPYDLQITPPAAEEPIEYDCDFGSCLGDDSYKASTTLETFAEVRGFLDGEWTVAVAGIFPSYNEEVHTFAVDPSPLDEPPMVAGRFFQPSSEQPLVQNQWQDYDAVFTSEDRSGWLLVELAAHTDGFDSGPVNVSFLRRDVDTTQRARGTSSVLTGRIQGDQSIYLEARYGPDEVSGLARTEFRVSGTVGVLPATASLELLAESLLFETDSSTSAVSPEHFFSVDVYYRKPLGVRYEFTVVPEPAGLASVLSISAAAHSIGQRRRS